MPRLRLSFRHLRWKTTQRNDLAPERQSETSANPSTFGAEIGGQIRLINTEPGPSKTEGSKSMTVPPLLTFPARPIQGGRLELAPPKRGLWFAEPKLNGWRAMIHTPTGTMWNRHGALLTIAECFRPALANLRLLAGAGIVWADCETLERRHNLGRGTLLVLDLVPQSGALSYLERRQLLESLLESPAVFADGEPNAAHVPQNAAILIPALLAATPDVALAFYRGLRALGCDFFEGVVMKRADSPYPVQLRSTTEEFRGWVKHRLLT